MSTIASQFGRVFGKGNETIVFTENTINDEEPCLGTNGNPLGNVSNSDVEVVAAYTTQERYLHNQAQQMYVVVKCNGASEGTPFPDDLSLIWEDGLAVRFEYQEDGTLREMWDDSGDYAEWIPM